MRKIRIIISGGGTGGHVFPALAIAQAIEKQVSHVEFLFVGANNRMEMEKVPNAGYNIIGLWINGLQRGLDKRNLLFPFKLLHSLWKSKRIIRKFDPDLVIGTGGYASGPLIFIAAKAGIPSLIQEQNSYPGITNKILAKYVNKICVAYDKMERFFPLRKIIFTGNPIRKDILGFEQKKQDAQKLFNLDRSRQTILVVGGSLGALTINKAISKGLKKINSMNLNLIWQTGSSYESEAHKSIQSMNIKGIKAYTFIENMDKAYAAADVIVSRAGAIAISELCCIGKPIILVPSPNVAENHQYKNAQSLVNKKAALLVEDAQVNRKLVSTLELLLKDQSLRENLINNIKKIAVTDAAEKIARIGMDLVK